MGGDDFFEVETAFLNIVPLHNSLAGIQNRPNVSKSVLMDCWGYQNKRLRRKRGSLTKVPQTAKRSGQSGRSARKGRI